MTRQVCSSDRFMTHCNKYADIKHAVDAKLHISCIMLAPWYPTVYVSGTYEKPQKPVATCPMVMLSYVCMCSWLGSYPRKDAPSFVHSAYSLKQVHIKQLASDWHFNLIEGIFEDKICVKIIHPTHTEPVSCILPCCLSQLTLLQCA